MRNFLAASLLATEAFLAASNLSCLLLSNKSILNLLVFMILLFYAKIMPVSAMKACFQIAERS